MPTFFSWIKADEVFDQQRHARNDLEIFQLIIQHQEGEVALATITISARTRLSRDQQHAVIAFGEGEIIRPIFLGRRVGLPLCTDQEMMQLQFAANVDEVGFALLVNALKEPPHWDELFVDPLHKNNPTEVLEARNALFAWDRVTGRVVLSDLFQGRRHVRYENSILADSLKIKMIDSPLEAVQVRLVAEWVQTLDGEANLEPYIARHFSQGMINTVTPEVLKECWPMTGTKLGRSGYVVLDSDLKEVRPPYTGGLNLYPTVSPVFQVWNERTQKLESKRLKRHWFRGKLVLGWSYRQKRREIVNFTLEQKTVFPASGKRRQLTLGLQAVGDSDRASFFLTDRGRQAIAHGIEIGKCHLASSARCVAVEAMVPIEEALDLSMDHSVTLCAPTLPGGEMTGKLTAYRFVFDGANAYAWIRMVVAVGDRIVREPITITQPYVAVDYGSLGPQEGWQTPSGIVCRDYTHQKPTQGLVNGLSFSFQDLVEEIVVQGDGAQQVVAVLNQRFSRRTIFEALSTQFRLRLMDLQTTAVAEHEITLELPQAWSAPRQYPGR